MMGLVCLPVSFFLYWLMLRRRRLHEIEHDYISRFGDPGICEGNRE